MKIDIGAKVRAADGKEIGKVERVIVDSETKEVDAIVVHRGLLLTRDVVVSLSLVEGAGKDGVSLRIDRTEVDALPDFVERHYTRPTPGQISQVYPYAPGSMLFPLAPPLAISGLPPAYESVEETVNVPRGDVDIREGTSVWTVDGEIGVVDQVLTDSLADRVSAIVVKRGFILTRDVEIPIEFVEELADDHIKLNLTNQQVEDLPLRTQDRYVTVEGEERPGRETGTRERET